MLVTCNTCIVRIYEVSRYMNQRLKCLLLRNILHTLLFRYGMSKHEKTRRVTFAQVPWSCKKIQPCFTFLIQPILNWLLRDYTFRTRTRSTRFIYLCLYLSTMNFYHCVHLRWLNFVQYIIWNSLSSVGDLLLSVSFNKNV